MRDKETRIAGNPPTAAQLKDAIDRGETADKVDFPDPAISPLGTDAEAGGASPSPAEVASAVKEEVAAKPHHTPRSRTFLAIAGFAILIAAAAVVSVLVMAGQ